MNKGWPSARITPVERSLADIEARDTVIGAWCFVSCEAGGNGSAAHRNGSADAQPLGGLPFGVKDMIDVEGMPTCAGSRSRSGAAPEKADAVIVGRLRAVGAVPLGKTVTTEFAYIDPAATRNPYGLQHTPGGSSSGSAAAVAAGMVPVALGTQTAGSLCRPAAYCGIAAIKPSYGLLPTKGIVPLSPSFDTPGVMARTVRQAAQSLAVMANQPEWMQGRVSAAGRLACLPARHYAASSPDVNSFHIRTLRTLNAAGFEIEEIDLDIDFDAIVADHRVVMFREAYEAHFALLDHRAEFLQPRFRAALRSGSEITAEMAAAARARIAAARERAWNRLAGYSALILQPVPDVAPAGLATTGDQSYLTPWTALHGPMITVPAEFNNAGLPLATLIAAAPGADATAIAIANETQRIIDRLPLSAPFQADRSVR